MSPVNADLVNPNKDALSMMFRGVTGVGKTIAACGKEFRPVYVFDCDQRMASVINYYRKLDGHCKDVFYDSFSMGMHFDKLDGQMDYLIAHPKEFKTISVATLTAYIHIILAHILKFKSGQKEKGKKIADISVNSIEDYNAEDAALIFELVGFMKDLQRMGVNVILETHLTPIVYSNLEGASRTVLETLTKGKKAPAAIPGYFDEVYYFKKEHDSPVVGFGDVKYTMSTKGDFAVDAKSSRGINGFDWTGKDFSVELMRQLNQVRLV